MPNLNGSEFQQFQIGNVLPVDKITAINSSQNNFNMVSTQIGGRKRVNKLNKTSKKTKKQTKKQLKKNKNSMRSKKIKKLRKSTLKN